MAQKTQEHGPYLEMINSARPRRIRLGDQAPLTIGRHPDNGVHLHDDRASRYHCVVEHTGNNGARFRIRDLDSRNGVKVNGKRVPFAELRAGDVLRVGSTEFRYMLPGAVPAASGHAPASSSRKKRPSGKSRKKSTPHKRQPHQSDASSPTQHSQDIRTPSWSQSEQTADQASGTSTPEKEEQEEDSSTEAASHYRRTVRDLQRLIKTLPGEQLTDEQLELINARGEVVEAAGGEADKGEEKVSGGVLLRLMLLVAVRTRATDVHIEPKPGDYPVRIRVDGVMVDATKMHPAIASRLMSVVKVLCDINIAQKNVVQEGHFSTRTPDRSIDYRVSFTPSIHGQKLVLRVLDLAYSPKVIQDLELPEWMNQTINKTIRQSSCMVLVCGPTGSGKTTTLYAVIRDINVNQRNVITIEDPVEYQIKGVTQIPINEHKGNTFSSLLKSVLRQDPDVILLGEIRDRETARIGMQAAVTGHLVLSTVHAKDVIGTVFRLIDLGVEPYLVASALNLVLAQRLVRRLCPHCKVPARPKPQQQMRMGRQGEGLSTIYYPGGCDKCLKTGFHGRRGVFELLTVNEEFRDVILANPTIQDLRKAINMTLFSSLGNSGYRLVAEGETSLDEVERIVGVEG